MERTLYDEDHEAFRGSVREFLDRQVRPHLEDYQDAHALPREFWLYSAFSAATMLGFATWGVLAFHLTHRHVVSAGWVPVLYAAAMATAAIAALGSGRMYDRRGLRGLVVLPLLAMLVPLLSFATSVPAVVIGAGVWGVGMGVHDSTMRAAVTDLVPRSRRGAG